MYLSLSLRLAHHFRLYSSPSFFFKSYFLHPYFLLSRYRRLSIATTTTPQQPNNCSKKQPHAGNVVCLPFLSVNINNIMAHDVCFTCPPTIAHSQLVRPKIPSDFGFYVYLSKQCLWRIVVVSAWLTFMLVNIYVAAY